MGSSKIIEEKCEDAPNSVHSYEKSDADNNQDEDLEKDIACLLDSETISMKKMKSKGEQDLSKLET